MTIGFKEDEGDVDIFAYGNTKYGTNTLLDADDDWLLVKIESAKGTVTKLIRLSSITSIAEKK